MAGHTSQCQWSFLCGRIICNCIFFLLVICVCEVASVVSVSLQPHGLQPASLRWPWGAPGKNTGVGCHFFSKGSSLCLLCLPALAGRFFAPRATIFYSVHELLFWKKKFFLRLCFSTSFQCSLLKVFVVGVCTTPEKVWLFLSLTVFRLAVPKLIKQKTTNRDFPAVNEGGSVAFVSKSSRFSNGQTEHNSFLCR